MAETVQFKFTTFRSGSKLPTPAQFIARQRAVMVSVIADGQRLAATYPSQVLTKTHYRRTHTLARSWSGVETVTQVGDRIEGTIGSNGFIAPYNLYVQGPDGRYPRVRLMFRMAGWLGVDQIVPRIEADLQRKFRDANAALFGATA